jgi:hypothetical protein
VVCGLLLFPLRALSLVLLILVSYPFAKIALLGLSGKVPMLVAFIRVHAPCVCMRACVCADAAVVILSLSLSHRT